MFYICASQYVQNLDYDIIDALEKGISLYKHEGNIMIAVDFNANTRTDRDYVDDKNDDHSPINGIHSYNCDKHPVDSQGKRLLDLCKK